MNTYERRVLKLRNEVLLAQKAKEKEQEPKKVSGSDDNNPRESQKDARSKRKPKGQSNN